MCSVLLISILVIIWWGEQDRLKWFALCIEQPMLCALPLLGISTPFFEALVDAFANAVLLLSDRLLRQGHSNERDLLQTCKVESVSLSPLVVSHDDHHLPHQHSLGFSVPMRVVRVRVRRVLRARIDAESSCEFVRDVWQHNRSVRP